MPAASAAARKAVPGPLRTGRNVALPVVSDEHRLRVQPDAEALAHAAGDLARQRHQLRGARAAAVDERERVLGRDADAPVPVTAREPGPLDQPRGRRLDPAVGLREGGWAAELARAR